MFEFVVLVVEGDDQALEFGLQIGDLFIEGVDFALGLSFVADFEGIYFLCEHEDAVLGHMFG